jgi:hypothetical protein
MAVMDFIGFAQKQNSLKTIKTVWLFSSLLLSVATVSSCSDRHSMTQQQAPRLQSADLASTSTDEIFPDNPVIGDQACVYDEHGDCSNLDPRTPPAKVSPPSEDSAGPGPVFRRRSVFQPLTPQRRQQLCETGGTCGQRRYPYPQPPRRQQRRVPIYVPPEPMDQTHYTYYGTEGIGSWGYVATTTRFVNGQDIVTYTYRFFEQRPDRLLQTPVTPQQSHMSLCWLLADHGYNFYAAYDLRQSVFHDQSCNSFYGYQYRPWWNEK